MLPLLIAVLLVTLVQRRHRRARAARRLQAQQLPQHQLRPIRFVPHLVLHSSARLQYHRTAPLPEAFLLWPIRRQAERRVRQPHHELRDVVALPRVPRLEPRPCDRLRCFGGAVLTGHRQLRIDGLQVPAERTTVEALAERAPFANVAVVDFAGGRLVLEEVILKIESQNL